MEEGKQHYDGRLSDRRAMWRGIRGRCPNCGTPMFKSLWGLHAKCRGCDVRFERDNGAWLGAMVIAYAFAIVAIVVVGAVTITMHGLYRGLELVLLGTGVVAVALAYRPVKGFWVWSMWAAGIVTTDDEHGRDLPAAAP